MSTLLKNGNVFTPNGFKKTNILISNSKVSLISTLDDTSFDNSIDCNGLYIVPGFADVHVHFREPGFFYKESIATGSLAAARGGYTQVCTMPNVNPAPADLKSLDVQLEIIKNDSVVHITPYATITSRGDGRSTLSKMADMADYVVGYSDDGKGVQTGKLMEEAMIMAKSLDKIIVAHCEDESLLDGGYIHKGIYAENHNHKGISSESEWVQVARDVELAKKTGCKYHVCHISTKETVDIIRRAKAKNVDVTCETAPHYLILCDEDLKEEGRFKMNPPLRSKEDRAALIKGIQDGTIDMIATDHAPHSQDEKSRGLQKSPFGIVGLETAFSLLYTHLVKKDIISLEKLIELMCINPRKRFPLTGSLYIENDTPADITVLDLSKKYKIDSKNFLSKGKATPFDGEYVIGDILYTFVDGNMVYDYKNLPNYQK